MCVVLTMEYKACSQLSDAIIGCKDLSDDTWSDGFSVKRGDGSTKYLWGDDAEVFQRDRWLNENGHLHQESPFKFTAFQESPRICIRKKFSYREKKVFSALRLDSFIFKPSDEEKASTAGRWSPYTLMGAFMCILLQDWGI
ncbi:hypothetical protein PS1_001794 [Malus domestica]